MYRVLVVAPRGDYHAVAVSWALEQYGVKVHWYDTSSRMDSEKRSLHFDRSGSAVFLEENQPGPKYNSVWRRRTYPWEKRPKKGPDAKFIYLEASAFDHGMVEAAGRINTDFCMNERQASLRAENKLIQIQEAIQAGLNVPRTLFSQNPVDIRSFLEQDFNSIVKPFTGQIWTNELTGVLSMTAATPLPESWYKQADFSAAVALCPAIYQEKIDKVADLRVVVFSESVIAVEIRTDGAKSIDCREAINMGEASARLVEIEADVATSILQMCASLEINYASIDFAKTKKGELFFLDLNPAGQFLYVEELAPASMLLDRFSRCLATGGQPDTLLSKGLTLAQFESSEVYSSFVDDYSVDAHRNTTDGWLVAAE